MPRFYFHTEDGRCFVDEDGSDLPDLKSASVMALQVLAEHLQTKPEHFWEHDCLQVHVADATGLRLLSLTVSAMFSAAVADPKHVRPAAVRG